MPPSGLRHISQRLIHRSAWKGNSANYFALTEFSEVQIQGAVGGTASTHGFDACTHCFHQGFYAVRLVQASGIV
jgi:hypothetical protein